MYRCCFSYSDVCILRYLDRYRYRYRRTCGKAGVIDGVSFWANRLFYSEVSTMAPMFQPPRV